MLKQTALNYSIKAMVLSDDARYRAMVCACTIGGDDSLTVRALADVETFLIISRAWEGVACLHPKTRAKLILAKSLPVEMFV